jgi:hypothetical protein
VNKNKNENEFSAYTVNDFYLYNNTGERYMTDSFSDVESGLVLLSQVEKETNQKYRTFRNLTIGDDASEITEVYKDIDWNCNIIIPYYIYFGTESEKEKYLNKLLEIKNKPEYVNSHSAGELIENESSIIGDENFMITLEFKAVSKGNELYAYNELPEIERINKITNKYDLRSDDMSDYICLKIGREKYEDLLTEIGNTDIEGDNYYYIKIFIQNQKIVDISVMAADLQELQTALNSTELR